ncbi:unnamed protein product [Cylindrotheca closterium]|uniref:Uncharacterized protein n=1 Tax=Cylindrotheca closterium TaxID=2856 RepID=A0AAD2PWQ8_9STRA|nr:unnamed protein product [Cylindrotheca closterium]
MVFDMFHESIQDNLDLFGHLAMESEGQEQLKYFQNFQQFYEILPDDGRLEYGRIHTRTKMLLETVDLTVGLLLMNSDVDADAFADYNVSPLDEWSRKDWKECKQGLSEVLEKVLEKGATAGINEENDETIADDRAASKKYNIEKLCRGLDVCALLAPLRSALKDHLVGSAKKASPTSPTRSTPRRGTPKVSSTIMNNFHKEIEKLEDPILMSVLKELVIEDENSGDLKMKDIKTVRQVLDNDQLKVERIATKTIEKLKSWNKDMFPDPRLYSLHFGEDDDEDGNEAEDSDDGEEEEEETEDQAAAVQNLRSSRARLMDSVDDPLEEAVAAASKASTPRGGRRAATKIPAEPEEEEDVKPEAKNSSSKKRKRKGGEELLKKKKSATQMSFDDDDDEDIPDPSEDTLLSDLPERAAASTPKKSPKTSPKRTQIKQYAGRRAWNDQEKNAIKQGIRELGTGKWAQIKERWKVTLQYRTSGQIKDCYRTMLRRNELGDVFDTV